jgi:hypothetical protein
MSWMAVAVGGSALISAGASAYSSNAAAGAQGDAANKNRQLQQLGMNQSLAMFEPNRALGYGASSDLASLYGYAMPEYTPLNSLINGQFGGGSGVNLGKHAAMVNGQIKVDGRGGHGERFPGSGSLNMGGDLLGIMGSERRKFGGYIDPVTGTVNIPGQDERSALATEYLRTGQGLSKDKNPGLGRIISQIDAMRAQGWTYDPNAKAKLEQQQAGPMAGSSGSPQAGNMSRFFTSPDYQFRLNEGQRDIGNSFAARGGAASGNALRALTQFNQNTASGEYGNYVNRLMQMSGLGQVATNNGANAVQNGVNGMSQANTQQGDARASGIMGTANGISSSINSGLNNYMLYRGGYFNRPAGG